MRPDEEVCWSVLDDRSALRVTVVDLECAWSSTVFSASPAAPGVLVVLPAGGDPVLVDREHVEAIRDLCASVLEGSLGRLGVPRACEECDGLWTHEPGCEMMPYDRTPSPDDLESPT